MSPPCDHDERMPEMVAGGEPPWWFREHAKRVETCLNTLVASSATHAEEIRTVREEQRSTRAKIETHLAAHGLGSGGAKTISVWVATTAMHAYHARGRIVLLLLVLLAAAFPALLPYVSHAAKAAGVP